MSEIEQVLRMFQALLPKHKHKWLPAFQEALDVLGYKIVPK